MKDKILSVYYKLKEIVLEDEMSFAGNINISEIACQHIYDFLYKRFVFSDLGEVKLGRRVVRAFSSLYIQKYLSCIANKKTGITLEDTDILLFSFAKTHTEVLLPLLKKISSEGRKVAICRSAIGSSLPIEEISCVSSESNCNIYFVDQYLNNRIFIKQLNYFIYIRKNLKYFLCKNRQKIDSISQEGVSSSFLCKLLSWYFLIQLPLAYRHILHAKIIINEKLKFIIFGNDFCSRARALIYVARNYGIPTLVIQHGTIAHPQYYVPFADYMAVWGRRDFDLLENVGVDSKRLLISGSPKYKVHQQFSNNELYSRKCIIFASSPEIPKTDVSAIIDMIWVGIKDSKFNLLIKPHPREDISFYLKIVEQYEDIEVLSPKTNLHNYLNNCVLGIVYYSTVVFDFLVRGIPVVSVISVNKNDLTGMSNYSIIKIIRSSNDLCNVLSNIEKDEIGNKDNSAEVAKFLIDYLGPYQEDSSEVILEFIKNKMNNGTEILSG